MKKAVSFAIYVSFAFYLLIMVYFLFLKTGFRWPQMSFAEYAKGAVNLIPFRTIGEYSAVIIKGGEDVGKAVKNLAGNALMLLPLGLYLPFFKKRLTNALNFLGFVTLSILAVEVLQILTRRGRFDIDDFILNILGAALGYVLFQKTPLRKLVQRLSI